MIQAGRMLGLGRTLAFALVKDGLLASAKIGRRRVVAVASVRELLAERLQGGGVPPLD